MHRILKRKERNKEKKERKKEGRLTGAHFFHHPLFLASSIVNGCDSFGQNKLVLTSTMSVAVDWTTKEGEKNKKKKKNKTNKPVPPPSLEEWNGSGWDLVTGDFVVERGR